jgi:hypothetical protein
MKGPRLNSTVLGAKAQIGVDTCSGLMHAVHPANVSDINVASDPLQGEGARDLR